jgi:chromosome segregation ATPase
MLSASNGEMEKLRKRRTELEARLEAIEEEQKATEEETKVLREKVAIQELERSLRKRQAELSGLRLEKKRLEDGPNGL